MSPVFRARSRSLVQAGSFLLPLTGSHLRIPIPRLRQRAIAFGSPIVEDMDRFPGGGVQAIPPTKPLVWFLCIMAKRILPLQPNTRQRERASISSM